MLRGDEKYGDELRKRAMNSRSNSQSRFAADSKAEISKTRRCLQGEFPGLHGGSKHLDGRGGRPRANLRSPATSLIAVRKAQTNDSNRSNELASVQRYVFWSICVTILVMVALALLFGRWLSTPLVTMAMAMERLSQGISTARSNRSIVRDEIGKISSALFIFHENCLKTGNLQQSKPRRGTRRDPASRGDAAGC